MSLYKLICVNNTIYIVVNVDKPELIDKLDDREFVQFQKLDGKSLLIRAGKISSIEEL